jgi:prepilin-type N-terminal cleavage/methylation domain-containing protein
MVHRTGRCGRRGAVRNGYSLVEVLIAAVIMCVLVAMGVPRFQQSLEQSRANVAWGSLRSIWSAQRLYWLENRTYAPDLPTLQSWIPVGSSLGLTDPSLTTTTAPYTYQMTVSSDGSSFTATATRSGPTSWSGSFTIDASGDFSGSVQQGGQGPTIVPNYQ